jgi:predicted SAM-dependent methyltransferase
MIPFWVKRAYYAAFRIPMFVNGAIYRAFRQPKEPISVQLGCGMEHYLPGWVNVDGNIFSSRPDVWANLLDGLPFRDSSVKVFYSHHVIEHLPDRFLPEHFRDMYRCLVPGGAIRVGGPDMANACRKFIDGDLDWFSVHPVARKSIGGRLTNFIFCDGEHLSALTESYLTELASDAGFVDVRRCSPVRESSVVGQDVLSGEWESDFEVPHTLLIEARKPG